VSAHLDLRTTSALVLTLQGQAMAGDDTPALVMFGTVTWRPTP